MRQNEINEMNRRQHLNSSATAKHFLILCLLIALSMIGCSETPVSSPQDAGVNSWDDLETKLEEAIPEVLDSDKGPHDYTFEVSAMRKIRDGGSRDLWLEMCRMTDLPMVATGGYLCLAERLPEDRFEAALVLLANRSEQASLIFYYPAIMYLSEQAEPNAKATQALDRVLAASENDDLILAYLMVPKPILSAWIESGDVENAPAAIQGLAVDAAFIVADEQSQPVTETAQKLLNSFKDKRDIRVTVWLRHADVSIQPQAMRDAIVFVLKSDELNDGEFHFALRNHLDFVRAEMDLDRLSLTPTQQERIAELLDQYSEE
jgi:hypothetical protein